MAYTVRIKASAERSLRHIAKPDRIRLVEAIDRLADEPTAGSALKGEFTGLRRLRVGPTVWFTRSFTNELLVLVVRVGHRREVYR